MEGGARAEHARADYSNPHDPWPLLQQWTISAGPLWRARL
jgi:hypothetical protein